MPLSSSGAPDRELAREKYRHLASTYDQRVRLRMAESVRREAVDLLYLKRGDVVIDVACGTGLSFPLLEERIGAEGRLIGIDLSPDMLEKARERIEQAGWKNVTLVEGAVEDATIPVQADAVFFHFTHDVMRDRAALENIFRHARPGARIVSAGGKWAPWWNMPVNLVIWRVSRRYITTFEGFTRPWSHLQRYVPNLRVKPVLFGAGYITWGRTQE